jgi:hypothetical protein
VRNAFAAVTRALVRNPRLTAAFKDSASTLARQIWEI